MQEGRGARGEGKGAGGEEGCRRGGRVQEGREGGMQEGREQIFRKVVQCTLDCIMYIIL